jgi:hypothetical protein
VARALPAVRPYCTRAVGRRAGHEVRERRQRFSGSFDLFFFSLDLFKYLDGK